MASDQVGKVDSVGGQEALGSFASCKLRWAYIADGPQEAFIKGQWHPGLGLWRQPCFSTSTVYMPVI